MLRRAVSYRDAATVRAVCGGLLHFRGLLCKHLPEAEYKDASKRLHEQFMTGCLDPEITSALETTLPPGDVRSISFCRHLPVMQTCCVSQCCCCLLLVAMLCRILRRDLLQQRDMQVEMEAEEHEAKLAKKVREATLQHLEAKLSADFKILASRLPTPESQAKEAALDVKYVKDRQLLLECDGEVLSVESRTMLISFL